MDDGAARRATLKGAAPTAGVTTAAEAGTAAPPSAPPTVTTWAVLAALAVLAVLAVLTSGLLIGPAGCGGASPPPPNLILIILDTVRADRLGCYGGTAGLTPNIDAFAERGVRFAQAYAQAPWTLPSVASILTSRYPIQHGAAGRLNAFRLLEPDAVTLPEVFRDAGWTTGAIINVFFLTETFGMTQGFESVDVTESHNNREVRRAGPTTDAALAWIDNISNPAGRSAAEDAPFFLMVHYFDAHLVYDPPKRFRAAHADPRDAEGDDYLFGTVADMIALREGEAEIGADLLTRLEQLYDGEVAYVDSEIGRLLEGLATRGLTENTVIAMVADHGEEFGDHGGFEHGHTLYDELIHVPLILSGPGTGGSRETAPSGDSALNQATGPQERMVGATVRLIDLAPTLCELAGIAPDPAFVGESLLPLIERVDADGNHGERVAGDDQAEPGGPGKLGADRPVFAEGNMWGASGASWRRGGEKIIWRPETETIELYAIEVDPLERNDLAQTRPGRVAALTEELRLIARTLAAGRRAGSAAPLTEEDRERLRSLGYIK